MDSKPKANLIISNNTYNIRYSSVHKSWMVMEINVVNFYGSSFNDILGLYCKWMERAKQ